MKRRITMIGSQNRERGFSMIEMLVATVILFFGIAAVVELVPRAMNANLRAKYDSSSVVVAERLLDQMLGQALTLNTFTNADGIVCSLGNPATPDVFVGAPVVVQGNRTVINFANNAIVAGYGYNWRDLNDASGPNYEIRWAIATRATGGVAVHRRILVGVYKRGPGGQNALPVTVEGAVGR